MFIGISDYFCCSIFFTFRWQAFFLFSDILFGSDDIISSLNIWSYSSVKLSTLEFFCGKCFNNQLNYFNKYRTTQFSSVTQSCLTLCDPTDCSTPGLPVHHQLPKLAQTHVHWVGDAIQPSHPLLSPSPPTFSLSQHPGFSQWVSSSHQVAKILGASVSTSDLPVNIQDCFPSGLTHLISLQSKTLKSLLQHHSSKASIL